MFRGAEPVNPSTSAHRVAANPPRNITGRIADDIKDEISEKNFLLSSSFMDCVTTFILKGTLPNRNFLNAENRSAAYASWEVSNSRPSAHHAGICGWRASF